MIWIRWGWNHFTSAPGRRWLKARGALVDDNLSAAGGNESSLSAARAFSEVLKIALEVVSNESENHYRSQYELLLAKD